MAVCLHHNRTRSGGEQRGITGNGASAEAGAVLLFAQVSAQADLKCSQLPDLMAPPELAGARGLSPALAVFECLRSRSEL